VVECNSSYSESGVRAGHQRSRIHRDRSCCQQIGHKPLMTDGQNKEGIQKSQTRCGSRCSRSTDERNTGNHSRNKTIS